MRYFEIINENITDTPAFRKWFGDSKVVNAIGEPLRLFHGTTHPRIQRFDVWYNSHGNRNFPGNHKVISFTTDPSFANGYAGDHEGAFIYPVYIRSENPGDFRNPDHVKKLLGYLRDQFERWIEDVKITHAHVWTPERIAAEREKRFSSDERLARHGAWQVWERPYIWKIFGWDGAWSREEPGHHNANVLNFAVADGRQVKSATGNRGTFDRENPKLTEVARPSTRSDADRLLRASGYRRLNQGDFGAIYQKPGKPYVLKVFSAGDQPYIDFIKLAQAHQDNQHFPKFFGKLVQVTPQYCAIRMEHLSPYKNDPSDIEFYLDFRAHKAYLGSTFALRMADIMELMAEVPGLQEACDLIIDNLLPKYELDIKQNNLMVRGKTIVFVDPVKGGVYDMQLLDPVEEPAEEHQWNKSDEDLLKELLGD